MRHLLHLAILVCTVTGTSVRAAEPASPLPPAREIRSVFNLSLQPCNGGGGNAYTRYPSEAQVKRTKQIDLPALGYRFNVPQLPDVQDTVVKVHLDDRSRGITDHYLLLANQDLEAPFAAIVVTELPQDMQSREAAFKAVRTIEESLARRSGLSASLREIDGPYGKSLEMLVPNRVGTHCYPTAAFTLVPPGVDVETTGISRFVFDGKRLIEFALIVRTGPHLSPERDDTFARTVMDGFWRSLGPIDGAH